MPSLAYQRAVQQTRERLLEYVAAMWDSLPAYRDADMERFVERVAPRLLAGQVQIATLTAADLARELGTQPSLVDRDAVTGGRGVPPEDVYARPFATVHAELAEGASLSAAAKAAGDRALKMVATDLQMAKVRQADQSMRAAGRKAFRRVLTGRENCGLCAIASTQRYWVGDLMPIHPGCDCDVEPMPASWDGDRVIEPELLEQVHESIRNKTGSDDRSAIGYQKLLLVEEHGEIGQVLTWRHQHFKSANEIPGYATTTTRRRR